MLFYGLTIFLSAFLLFLVQPLIGKVVLPWFGGGAAVWSAVMLFFQVLLLAGYAYSHWLISRLERRMQVRVHLALIGVSVVWLAANALAWHSPITPGAAWKPPDSAVPVGRILLALGVSVGAPYFVLATSGPLLQAWFGAQAAGRSPYPLYALSNLGSLLALASYPALIEPAFAVSIQGWAWTAGYALFVVGMGYIVMRVANSHHKPAVARIGNARHTHRWLWLGLSACASLLLVAVTVEMTQNVAAAPLLWVFPLALYLLSFILCFGRPAWYRRGFGVLFCVGALASLWVLTRGNIFPLWFQLGVHGLTLFAACMVCHGELVRLRPDPAHLTAFYLMIALGGALGSAFVNLVAPLVFNNFWELPLGLLLCGMLFTVAIYTDGHIPVIRGRNQTRAALAGLLLVGIGTFSYARAFDFATVEARRNFYGGLRVQAREASAPYGTLYRLVHGTTIHGIAYTSLGPTTPTAYFTPESGVGLALQQLNRRPEGQSVGVLGLGIGTLAAYSRPQDTYRFYEIDPQVIRYAEGEGGYFHYLRAASTEIVVVEGDARLVLESELARGENHRFDLLVLDVFSGDAMPVHLLTRESFDVYLAHLTEGGVLAVNMSMTHVNIQPVLAGLARHFGLHAVVIEDLVVDEVRYASRWALLTRDADFLATPEIAARGYPLEDWGDRLRLWTDDYSNVFQILY